MDIQSTKEQLQAKTESYKTALQSQVSHLTDDLEDTAKKAVFVLGAIAAVAVVFKLLAPKPKKHAPETSSALQVVHNTENPVVSMIRGAILSFLLNLARERIMGFLEELNKRNDVAANGKPAATDNA